MFSQFGKILDVVCLKTYRLRGQAWVVFADISGATNALRSMQEFPFFEKPMVSSCRASERYLAARKFQQAPSCDPGTQKIQYAKTKSDAVAKLDGSFRPRDKRERQKKNEVARGTTCTAMQPAAASCGSKADGLLTISWSADMLMKKKDRPAAGMAGVRSRHMHACPGLLKSGHSNCRRGAW